MYGIKLLRNPGFSEKPFRTISPKPGRPVLALLICDMAQTEHFKFQPSDAGNVTLLGKYDKSLFLDDLLNWILSDCSKSFRIGGAIVTALVAFGAVARSTTTT
jgi:hypothetical protein